MKRYEVGSPIHGQFALVVASYPDLDMEFLLPVSAEKDFEGARVTRFDITGPACPLRGIAVGMTEAQLRALYGEPVLYDLAENEGKTAKKKTGRKSKKA